MNIWLPAWHNEVFNQAPFPGINVLAMTAFPGPRRSHESTAVMLPVAGFKIEMWANKTRNVTNMHGERGPGKITTESLFSQSQLLKHTADSISGYVHVRIVFIT